VVYGGHPEIEGNVSLTHRLHRRLEGDLNKRLCADIESAF